MIMGCSFGSTGGQWLFFPMRKPVILVDLSSLSFICPSRFYQGSDTTVYLNHHTRIVRRPFFIHIRDTECRGSRNTSFCPLFAHPLFVIIIMNSMSLSSSISTVNQKFLII